MLPGMKHSDVDEGFLFERLLQAAARVEARLEESVAPAGLSLAKLNVLQHLVDAGDPLPLGQLAERIACVKSNVTQLVDRLESEGLVRRVTDADDRRIVRAVITQEGRRKYDEGAALRASAVRELAAPIPAPLRESAAELVSALLSVPARAS